VHGDLLKVVNKCVGWLDTHLSVVVLFPGEVVEMAHGLSSTGRQFMWVVHSETQPSRTSWHAAAAARLQRRGTSQATWTSPHSAIGSDWRAPMQQPELGVWELAAIYGGVLAEWDAFDFWCWCMISDVVASK
jgi:hypothetical protein